jgi:hypothetical protein
MTSQGSAQARFSRAVRDRHLQRTVMAAYELEPVTLENALELVLLAAELDDPRWPRFAAHWHARFVEETQGNRFSHSAQSGGDSVRATGGGASSLSRPLPCAELAAEHSPDSVHGRDQCRGLT